MSSGEQINTFIIKNYLPYSFQDLSEIFRKDRKYNKYLKNHFKTIKCKNTLHMPRKAIFKDRSLCF